MEYFNILNLHREPFSNSPEPDLFFCPISISVACSGWHLKELIKNYLFR